MQFFLKSTWKVTVPVRTMVSKKWNHPLEKRLKLNREHINEVILPFFTIIGFYKGIPVIFGCQLYKNIFLIYL